MSHTWTEILGDQDLQQIHSNSFTSPQLIFKHSPRCNISRMAKGRLSAEPQLALYEVDVVHSRALSQEIAVRYAVHHESPQLLILWKGECVFEASHFEINVKEFQEMMAEVQS